MEQQKKISPVEIVQKLIAIQSTRKEVSERMTKNNAPDDLQEKLKSVAAQSDRFMKALLNELSQFGDAVQSEVNREDEYHEIMNKTMGNIDTMDTSVLTETFKQSENSLINIYSEITDTHQDLPDTLNELLNTQLKELKQTL